MVDVDKFNKLATTLQALMAYNTQLTVVFHLLSNLEINNLTWAIKISASFKGQKKWFQGTKRITSYKGQKNQNKGQKERLKFKGQIKSK